MINDLRLDTRSIELDALGSVDFEWVRQLKSVWYDPPYHVDRFHHDIIDGIVHDFLTKTRNLADAPLGHVIVGSAGAGKTHVIGTLRRKVWEHNGWFVLLEFAGIKDFWTSTALCFVTSLNQVMPSRETQYQVVLSRLTEIKRFDPEIQPYFARLIEDKRNGRQPEREMVREFIEDYLVALKRICHGMPPYPDVVRACLLLVLGDWDISNVAYAWLQGLDLDSADLHGLGFSNDPPQPIDLVRGMSWLMGLSGPTLIAVDQIDAIVSEANLRRTEAQTGEAATITLSIIEALAGGLMDLHDVKYRAMTVVSCLDATWHVLQDRVTVAMTDRFRRPVQLTSIKDATVARQLIEARLAPAYAEAGFEPPYASWPFAPEAFASAVGFSPRQLLRACDDHRLHCLADGKVSELRTFGGVTPPRLDEQRPALDALFEEEKRKVDVQPLLAADADDKPLRGLLIKALELYAAQTILPDTVDLAVNADTGKQAPLHGRLTFTYHEEGDRERHYCFRALSHTNAIAFQSRLKAAMTASGIDRNLPFRHLVVLRHGMTPAGPKTEKLVGEFKASGGMFVAPSETDLRVIVALHNLREAEHEGFLAWLRARKPLCDTGLFHSAGLCEETDLDKAEGEGKSAVESTAGAATDGQGDYPARATRTPMAETDIPSAQTTPTLESPPSVERRIPIGRRIEGGGLGAAESIAVNQLPRHTAILGGAGSGKTVLLRRIIEEAALLKIPAIVLDTNNDLARLGDPWPTRPDSFSDEDRAKAEDYPTKVEVVVWTPGISSGRPMRLAVLPDFSLVSDDQDERKQAVDMANATLLPLTGVNPRTHQGMLQSGVLADALRAFASRDGKDLGGFIAFLSDLPEGASEIGNAARLASTLADRLRAAVATNPLLSAQGTPLDPQELFGDETADKTRISVISFCGLPADEAKQSFVNQLQMALFTFIKKHPSPGGRLYAMDEAKNFAPSQRSTPCKASTVSLAAQARKYGLGMIFATQAPKDIDNTIISNCTTHFYGKMSAPATIQAAQELVAAKGGTADDIARLTTGTFYFATEGMARPVKVRTPLCLSHHPQNPPDCDEIVARARSRPA